MKLEYKYEYFIERQANLSCYLLHLPGITPSMLPKTLNHPTEASCSVLSSDGHEPAAVSQYTR